MKRARLHVFIVACILRWPAHIYFYVYVVVQFYPWFNFCFPLFQTHYHTLPYPNTKENKIYTKDEIEPQHIPVYLMVSTVTYQYKRQMCGHCCYCFCEFFGTINFNGQSISKRSLNQFGPVFSKSEEKLAWCFTCQWNINWFQLCTTAVQGFRWLSGNLTLRHHNTVGKKINIHVWVKEIWVLIMTVTRN